MKEKDLIIRRLNKITDGFAKEGIDSLLIANPANVRYLSGFKGGEISNPKDDIACLFIVGKKRFFITDSRYELQVKKDVTGFEIKILDGPLSEFLKDLTFKPNARKIGFEHSHLSHRFYERLRKEIVFADLVPVTNVVERLRQIKDPHELDLIRNSVLILENAVIYFKSILKPGLSENDLAAKMEYFIRAASGERSSFEIIVASGSNSAFPHAKPTDRIIKPNDMVLLDLGVNYGGYNSDLTRVFFLGKINHRARKIHGIVKEAQKRSIKAIRPGAQISKVDEIARGFIRKKGFGKNFGHALGHGIGLEVHESPALSSKNHAELIPGMVLTIEPAIYLPGWGGIRIEDMILVTKKGCEILTDDIDK